MKYISLLILLIISINVSSNVINSTTYSSNEPVVAFSSPIEVNETEGLNFAVLNPVEERIIDNKTILVIEPKTDSSENTNQTFIISTDILSPNTQIESDSINKENETILGNDDNVSNAEFEKTDLNTESKTEDSETTSLETFSKRTSFITPDLINDTTDFETTTLETVNENPGLQTISAITETPDLETNTDAVSDKPELQTKALNTTIESRGLESIIERSPFKLFCGFGSWAAHRQGQGKFGVQDLNSTSFVLQRCTHIIYAFVGLNSWGQVISLDPNLELDPLSGTFAQLRAIKQRHPHIKILIAMGGWDTQSDLFSFLVSDEGMRKSLFRNIPNFAKQHGFDGAIISWFYPGSRWRGGHPLDKQNLATFLQELKLKMNSNNLELGIMAPTLEEDIESGFDIPLVSNSVDHLLLMTYDYYGPWDQNVNHFAPLYGNKLDNEKSRKLNINYTLNYWLERGAKRQNTVLGLATYGRSFTLADPLLNKVNSPSIGPGMAGPYTNRPGVIGFNEICELFLSTPGVKLGEDDHKVTPYIHLYDQWIGFEDELSLFLKTLYAMDNKLEGVFLWSLDLDDFQNKCGWGHFPLLKSSIQAIYKNQNIH